MKLLTLLFSVVFLASTFSCKARRETSQNLKGQDKQNLSLEEVLSAITEKFAASKLDTDFTFKEQLTYLINEKKLVSKNTLDRVLHDLNEPQGQAALFQFARSEDKFHPHVKVVGSFSCDDMSIALDFLGEPSWIAKNKHFGDILMRLARFREKIPSVLSKDKSQTYIEGTNMFGTYEELRSNDPEKMPGNIIFVNMSDASFEALLAALPYNIEEAKRIFASAKNKK